ncbi:hypothetical protein MAA_10503 [Metarhizium robertsii ARSEF 23]|uniref:Uncharacterized protein n=1 Tax=Metarhizium robertsii (strain ARSEF 23 / ATCC MYA-3075) TaxID=655844 RepID=E9FE04_METRA|nr:uncharacterized protein MAA_10503 [Metarhizium robertsii ARSEF 23]EFY94036.1 hypothetical protein MAA_10503 [Metarhizium robertsii ARSEF 23]
MKFSYPLVAALMGVAAASPIGEASLSKRFDQGKIDGEVRKLSDLIDGFQKAKDEKQENKGEGWQKNIDTLKEIRDGIKAAPADKALEEIKKLDGPIDRMRQSREDTIDRRTKFIFDFEDAKDSLLQAAQ